MAAAPTRAFVGELAAAGIEVRTSSERAWFFVARDRVAVLPVDWPTDDAHRDTSATSTDESGDEADVAVIRSGPIIPVLAALFEHRWRSARPWLDDEQAGVLRLLAEGLDDEAVATRLDVSVRTVRRRVAEAMLVYGASTRFELGHRYGSAPH